MTGEELVSDVLEGLTVRQIAEKRGITRTGVYTHRAFLLKKGVRVPPFAGVKGRPPLDVTALNRMIEEKTTRT